jgi:uncharacterized membrane protein
MRKVLYIAAGYTALNLLTEQVSVPGLEVVRPGIAVPVLCGLLCGLFVGLGVGFLGSSGSDLLTFGFYWNWSLGNGLVGMVAGLGPFLFSRCPLYSIWQSFVSSGVLLCPAGSANA